jgi:VWFA-related protein
MPKARSSWVPLASALTIALLSFAPVAAQSKERPKLKDFGSSLKRLKWDARQNAAIDTKPNSKAASNSSGDDVVRVDTSLVVNDVLVLDSRGQPVSGLTTKDFAVTEDGNPQQLGMFSLGDNAIVPRSIILIMDYSCMELPFLQTSVMAAKMLVDKIGSADRMAIVTDDVEVLVNYTSNRNKLKDGLDLLVRRTSFGRLPDWTEPERRLPFGHGFQFSALMAVLKEAFDDEDVRPIIIFQTQGWEAFILKNEIGLSPMPAVTAVSSELKSTLDRADKHRLEYRRRNRREFSLDDIYRAAEKSRATIYAVSPGFRLLGLSEDEQITRMRTWNDRVIAMPWMSSRSRKLNLSLPREMVKWEAENTSRLQSDLAVLSTITGGWLEFLDHPAQAEEIYTRIISDINRRYLIGYYPTNKERDGRRRKISITVRNHPEYVVMSRKAYYAPSPN